MIHKLVFSPTPKNKNKNKALFLDRDGVINRKPAEHSYVYSWQELVLNPGVPELINSAIALGYLIIVVTNQRGIGRGLLSMESFLSISKELHTFLLQKNAPLTAIYYCPHDYSENCHCRKPLPGLFDAAIKDFNIDVSQSIAVGDSDSDIQAAAAVGIKQLYQVASNTIHLLPLKNMFK